MRYSLSLAVFFALACFAAASPAPDRTRPSTKPSKNYDHGEKPYAHNKYDPRDKSRPNYPKPSKRYNIDDHGRYSARPSKVYLDDESRGKNPRLKPSKASRDINESRAEFRPSPYPKPSKVYHDSEAHHSKPSKVYRDNDARVKHQPSPNSKPSKDYPDHIEARGRHEHPSLRPSSRYLDPRDVDLQAYMVTIDDILCPFSMSACPIEQVFTIPKTLEEWDGIEHECVEFETDLQSCGGCASVDKKHDCSAIEGAVNVACVSGGCKVHSCKAGFSVSADASFCAET